ncbi:MAG: tRNA epoxyqueuosine(34) reductase QueG [Actinobacteria bacterium]|nr:MAG: tRNA epoxyqueuosine(34) reductase QueG [Actinomycetota bacterium]
MRQLEPLLTIDEIKENLAPVGVTHVGVASADVLTEARHDLHQRRDEGLHDTMEFTYRNPDRSTDPSRAVQGAKSVVVAARPYLTDTDPPPPNSSAPQARVGRYAWVDHYAPLREGLRLVAKRIRRSGHRAVAFADDNSIVDRAIAHQAGVGWYGKNANLLLPGAGSWFVLGSIITTADYQPAQGPVADGCGTCRKCLDGCPTGAIIAPGVIDARRCLSWVLQKPGTIPKEFREPLHDRIYGCDDCQDVCPISVRLGPRNTLALDQSGHAWVDAIELLTADDEWIEERYGYWYIAGRDFRWLRRNALLVIGNVADRNDRRALAVLEQYRSGIDPILAEHADWALARLTEHRTATPGATTALDPSGAGR